MTAAGQNVRIDSTRGDLDDLDDLVAHQGAILELIASGAGHGDVLTAVVHALEGMIVDSRCSILLLDPARGALDHGAAPSLPAAYTAAIDGIHIGPDAGSCGTAAYTGRRIVAEDIRTDSRWEAFRDLALPHGLRSCWSTPIRGRTGVLGTFAVYHYAPHRPGEREQRLVDRFTHLASVAIDHAGLFGALADSEERFRRAFEDNVVGMALTDLDGRLLKVNRALCVLLDRSEGELVGEPLTALATPTTDTDLTRAAHDGVHLDAVARTPTGRELELRVTASAVRRSNGSPEVLCVHVIDVTQRRAAERERRARHEAEVARAAAESANTAKSQFVTTLSHELRTPMQAIAGFAELLGTLDMSPGQRATALGHIASATSHVLSIVDDVLDLAAVDAGALSLSPAEVDVHDLVVDVVALLQPLAARRGVVVSATPCDAVTVADTRRLRQVLINLVTNAVQYNNPGGSVDVAVSRREGIVAVAVRDDGPGIHTDDIPRMFVPFDRLGAAACAPERPGSGLGLALVRALVEAMNGRIDVVSRVGVGTVVTVELPAAG